MHKIISAIPLTGYQLEIRFDNGTSGVVALQERLFGPMFEPLRDVVFFNQVIVDEFGAVCWPNAVDLAPDALYARLQAAPVTT
jgi:Protein of unknown function (DUF2442)